MTASWDGLFTTTSNCVRCTQAHNGGRDCYEQKSRRTCNKIFISVRQRRLFPFHSMILWTIQHPNYWTRQPIFCSGNDSLLLVFPLFKHYSNFSFYHGSLVCCWTNAAIHSHPKINHMSNEFLYILWELRSWMIFPI